MIFKIALVAAILLVSLVLSFKPPSNPCPVVFGYHKNKKTQEWYGKAQIRYDGSKQVTFTANVNWNGTEDRGIKIELKNKPNNLEDRVILNYKITFSGIKTIPRLTNLTYNEKAICKGNVNTLELKHLATASATHILTFKS